MADKLIEPKPTVMFFFRHLWKIIKVQLSNPKKIENFLSSNKRTDKAIIPSFEGYSGPMEEGMIYLLFNSEGKGIEALDTVMRLFWMTASDLQFHQIDSYLISQKFDSNQWDYTSRQAILTSQEKRRFKQVVSIENLSMEIEGTWDEGYKYQFHDKINNISGDLVFSPITADGVLTYYNGRWAINPSAYQRFYDMFALRAEGTLFVNGSEIMIKDARAIIEHSIGIFSTFNIKEWIWLNIQLANGAIHVFLHPLKVDGVELPAAEGAALIDGQWFHFLRNEINVIPDELEYDEIREEDIPKSWSVNLQFKGETLVELELSTLEKLSWLTPLSKKEIHYVTNYVLSASGSFEGKKITGRGTMEYLILRTK